MPGALTWDNDGDTMYSDELSDVLRTNVQPLTKFRQFANVKDASEKGLHRGEEYKWNRYTDVGTQGRELSENQLMPQTDITSDQASLIITEFGNSVAYSGKLQLMAKHDLVEIVAKALKNDARKAFDIAAFNEFDSTPCIIVPTGGTDTDSITLTENGTAASTNNVPLGPDHYKAISDLMSERNIPPFDGDDYCSIAHPSTYRPVKSGLESLNQYTSVGIDRVFRGEVGRYEGIRSIEQNQVPKGGAQDSTTWDPYTKTADIWNNAKSSWAFFFGEDTVAEAYVIPEEIRAKMAEDYGRSKGIAWYYLGGFGLVHDGAVDPDQCRVFKWDSLT